MCTTKRQLGQITGNKENILIGQTYWKGSAYPVREIDTEKQTFRVSVERLRDELIKEIRKGI